MFESNRAIPLVSLADQKILIQNSDSNVRHKLMVLLLLDCGLRVSEMCSLRLGNFDFQEQTLKVLSLKKRSEKPVYRTIPLTSRVTEALSGLFYSRQILREDTYLE